MHYREDRLWEIYTFEFVCHLTGETESDSCGISDNGQTYRDIIKGGASQGTQILNFRRCLIHVKKSRCVIFCKPSIVFTLSSKQPRYQVVKSTINGWGCYFPCRLPSLAEIGFNICFWLELLNALDLYEMAYEVIKNPTIPTITNPCTTSLKYECCIFLCYTEGILALVQTPVNVDTLGPKDGTLLNGNRVQIHLGY